MRNYNMDFMRGIAVLGLVFMNGYAFGFTDFSYVPLTNPPTSDSIIQFFSTLFIDGRFRTLFSLLFGAGLYIQWQRHTSIVQIKSRLYWLIIFGLIHGFLLWAGDILLIYGVSGWFIIKYLDTDNPKLLQKGIEFIVIAGVVTLLVMFSITDDVNYRDSAQFIDLYSAYYSDYFINNLVMYLMVIITVPLITMWMCVGIMLIGIYIYKEGILDNGLSNQQLLLCIIGAISFCGIRLCTSVLEGGFGYAAQEFSNMFAALYVSVLYIHLAVKFCNNQAEIGKLVQQVGRIAFTLYISQTIMQLLLYKILFPHWVLSFNRIDYWLVATCLVVIQLLFTITYSQYFKQGPLEFIWRKLIDKKQFCN